MNITEAERLVINTEFPNLAKLLYEAECSAFNRGFVSIFDHWLLRAEVEQIFPIEQSVIRNRQNKFKALIDHLFTVTPIYTAKFRRNRENKLSIKRVVSRENLHNKCEFHQTTEDNGNVFQLIIPEFSVVYTQGFDWTHTVDYIDSSKIEKFQTLVEKHELNWLNY